MSRSRGRTLHSAASFFSRLRGCSAHALLLLTEQRQFVDPFSICHTVIQVVSVSQDETLVAGAALASTAWGFVCARYAWQSVSASESRGTARTPVHSCLRYMQGHWLMTLRLQLRMRRIRTSAMPCCAPAASKSEVFVCRHRSQRCHMQSIIAFL